MKNYKIEFHGEFNPPLEVMLSEIGLDDDDEAKNLEDRVHISGFYTTRQISSASNEEAIKLGVLQISEDMSDKFPDIYLRSKFTINVDDIDEMSADYRLINEGYSFYL